MIALREGTSIEEERESSCAHTADTDAAVLQSKRQHWPLSTRSSTQVQGPEQGTRRGISYRSALLSKLGCQKTGSVSLLGPLQNAAMGYGVQLFTRRLCPTLSSPSTLGRHSLTSFGHRTPFYFSVEISGAPGLPEAPKSHWHAQLS